VIILKGEVCLRLTTGGGCGAVAILFNIPRMSFSSTGLVLDLEWSFRDLPMNRMKEKWLSFTDCVTHQTPVITPGVPRDFRVKVTGFFIGGPKSCFVGMGLIHFPLQVILRT